MPYAIIYDPDQQLAALIDPDTPRALGPVLLGPDSVTTLTAFVGALDRDPLTLLPWELDAQFAEFVVAVQAMQDAEQNPALAAQEPAGDDDTGLADLAAVGAIIEPLTPPAAPADTDQPEPAVTLYPPIEPAFSSPLTERCPNCQATTFEGSGEDRACAVCGVKVPERFVG